MFKETNKKNGKKKKKIGARSCNKFVMAQICKGKQNLQLEKSLYLVHCIQKQTFNDITIKIPRI